MKAWKMKRSVLHSRVAVEEMGRNVLCVCLSILPVQRGTRIIPPHRSIYRCMNLHINASSNCDKYLDAL